MGELRELLEGAITMERWLLWFFALLAVYAAAEIISHWWGRR